MYFNKETEMGEILVSYLRINNEVFQEVSPGYGTACDIVFRDTNKKVHCVEMKLRLNLDVLCQIMHWYKIADFVWVALPYSEYKKVSKYWNLFSTINIGIILIKNNGDNKVCIYREAKLLNNNPYNWNRYLSTKHANDVKAGSKLGKRSTPFSRTIARIRFYKKKHKNATIEECLKNIKHHYANFYSAKNSIKKLLADGVIKIKGF